MTKKPFWPKHIDNLFAKLGGGGGISKAVALTHHYKDVHRTIGNTKATVTMERCVLF